MRVAIDFFQTAAMNSMTATLPKYKPCMRLTQNFVIDALLCQDIDTLNDAWMISTVRHQRGHY